VAVRFDHFVAIDWSGAKGTRHRGIAVATAGPGDEAPRLVPAPDPKGWARGEVADFLEGLSGRVLAGFDFSFAPPFLDRDSYLPGVDAPRTAPDFWRFVDDHCRDDPDHGAHGFMHGVARAHFWMGAADGPKAGYLRWRVCEQAYNVCGGGKASTVFDCVGAAQVARASFSGMRLLHRLRAAYAVWPFDPPADRTIVEIYTRAMLQHARGKGLKIRHRAGLDQALESLGSLPLSGDGPLNDHETDVLVAAAALRRLAGEPRWWEPAGLTPAIATTEGWTFGIAGPSG
jgi:hypothetical protein